MTRQMHSMDRAPDDRLLLYAPQLVQAFLVHSLARLCPCMLFDVALPAVIHWHT